MKKFYFICFILIISLGVNAQKVLNKTYSKSEFIYTKGPNLFSPNGKKFFIMGTNLGNWLNPEGYMFKFTKTNSAHFINEMFCQMVGPDFIAQFWKSFKDNYITREDIRFIKSTGANTIRLPFHYKLFTDQDYMGLTSQQDGFARIDKLVSWCKEFGLHLILDMHDAPGGQTGDNIDDSYGYPWLFESSQSQQLFCNIWQRIAKHYKNEPTILGYELLNEPIPHYLTNKETLNAKLESIYKMATAAIRKEDKNHIILIGGAQWNSNFKPFKDSTFDNKLIYTCHRYGGEPTKAAIQDFINFRDSVNLPMYMGEIGHNTETWMKAFCKVMKENNVGYTFWPYKLMGEQCFVGIKEPADWNMVTTFSESQRDTYENIRNNRPKQAVARKAMNDFIEACKLKNCTIQNEYINALQMK